MIKDKNIVVLGGGTAGWLTALFLKLIFNQSNITLIESKKIGILGAGEGSVPILPQFLSACYAQIVHDCLGSWLLLCRKMEVHWKIREVQQSTRKAKKGQPIGIPIKHPTSLPAINLHVNAGMPSNTHQRKCRSKKQWSEAMTMTISTSTQ